MKKIIFVFVNFILFIPLCFCDVWTQFNKINESFIKDETSYFSTQLLIKYEENKIVEKKDCFSLLKFPSQFIHILDNKNDLYFLNTPKGYWIFNKKLETPLKISGNYQVDEIEVQDILMMNFNEFYSYEVLNENSIKLTKKNKKAVYSSGILAKKIFENQNIFELILCDRNNTPIKKIIYFVGTINNKQCFNKIRIYNLSFENHKYSEYITLSLLPVKNNFSLFNPEMINALVTNIEKYEK